MKKSLKRRAHIIAMMFAVMVMFSIVPAFAAGTSMGSAQSISIGQRVTGSFRKDQTNVTQYYRFRTGSTSGAKYTLKAEFLSYISDATNDGLDFGLKDKNGNNIYAPNGYSQSYYMFLSNDAGTTKSLTYTLNPNTDYYVWVENPWIGMHAKSYAITVTSSGGSGTTTTSLVTPVLTLDRTSITSADKNSVYVTGSVSYSVGQYVGVYENGSNVCYNYTTLSNTGGRTSFRLQIPSRYLSDGTQKFTVKALPVKNVVNTSNTVTVTVTIGSGSSNTTNNNNGGETGRFIVGHKVTVDGSRYDLISNPDGSDAKAVLIKAKNAGKVTIPAEISYYGKAYPVTSIREGAFSSNKTKTVTIRTMNLKKAEVRGSLSGSKVKTIKVKVGNKKQNKKFVKKYKKMFTKKNCGKKVKVK